MDDLLAHIDETIRKRSLLRRGQSVLVAVSGGVDSVVLLHVLHALSKTHGWKLTVAHLNHCLRGRSSDADERLVVRSAKQLGWPVIVERADVKRAAQKRKISIEMAARELRHDFLARTAVRLRIKAIALAHHADDQIELFFLRLFRGSGSEGLGGMKGRSKRPHVELVRPLLEIPKSALASFAKEQKIPFREDASNESIDFLRNRIRNELLPLMRKNYQPALPQTISRVMEILRSEAELISLFAEGWLEGKRLLVGKLENQNFAELPVALQRRCLQLQLRRMNVTESFDLIENLRQRPECPIKVSPDLAVVMKGNGRITIERAAPVIRPSSEFSEITLNGRPSEQVFSNVQFKWRLLDRVPARARQRQPGREFFDSAKVGSRIVLRHWRAGDRFQPIGMKASVKLQDLFVNQKIPRQERHRLVVAETAAGEIFWVENLRIGERFKLSDGTNRCLQWQWKRA